VIIGDTYNQRIRQVSSDGVTVTLAGSGNPGGSDGGGGDARFNQPAGLTLSDGRILVADRRNHKIRQVELNVELEGVEVRSRSDNSGVILFFLLVVFPGIGTGFYYANKNKKPKAYRRQRLIT